MKKRITVQLLQEELIRLLAAKERNFAWFEEYQRLTKKLNKRSMQDWIAYRIPSQTTEIYLQRVKEALIELYKHVPNNTDWYMNK